MNNSSRAELARILELLKTAIKQNEEHRKLLDSAYGDLLAVLSGEKECT